MNQPFHFTSIFCICTKSRAGRIVFLEQSVSQSVSHPHSVAPHLSKHGRLNCDVRVGRRTTSNETKLKNARRSPSVRPSLLLRLCRRHGRRRSPPPPPPPRGLLRRLDLSTRARAPPAAPQLLFGFMEEEEERRGTATIAITNLFRVHG